MTVPPSVSGPARLAYLGVGWACFGLGVVGAVLPVLPTTPFMIVALWAFSKSSLRLRTWLYEHRIFGPPLQRWHDHRVIPASAKVAALGAMTASLTYMVFFTEAGWPSVLAAAALMAVGAGYILTKPSRVRGVDP